MRSEEELKKELSVLIESSVVLAKEMEEFNKKRSGLHKKMGDEDRKWKSIFERQCRLDEHIRFLVWVLHEEWNWGDDFDYGDTIPNPYALREEYDEVC